MRTYKNAAPVLRAHLERLGMTAVEFSDATGIDAGTLRDLLQARKQNISTRNIMVMARSFGVGMQELMDEMA